MVLPHQWMGYPVLALSQANDEHRVFIFLDSAHVHLGHLILALKTSGWLDGGKALRGEYDRHFHRAFGQAQDSPSSALLRPSERGRANVATVVQRHLAAKRPRAILPV